nr:unnamed protein product [Spirometra erinaceieuropaei]
MPPPTCVNRYTLHDLLYACSISDGVVNLTRSTSKDGQRRTNTLNNKLDSACATDLQPRLDSLKASKSAQLPNPQILRDVYLNGTLESVAENILLIEQRLLDHRSVNEEWRQILAETVMSSPSVILRAALNLPANNTENVGGSRLYSQIFCGLLKIWSFVLDKRLILKDTPQSYLYLCGFVGPRFQDMELKDLSKAIILETQLLTNYLHIFRSAVLASPHWYLQMLIDVINAIFDRLQSASSAEELSVIESALCPCIAAVSRTWASLRAEEPTTRPELSRCLKGLLDTIVVRIATFTVGEPLVGSGQKRKWKAVPPQTATAEGKSLEDFRERGTLSPRIRNMLNSGLLYPLLQAIDPWALQQSILGLRPPSAREVLRNLISSLREKNATSEAPVVSRTPLVHAAVGGLGLRAKMRKRQRRRPPTQE